MKKFYYSLWLYLLAVASTCCSTSDDEQISSPTHPATRTIFIGSGEIMVDYDKDIRKPIRIMLDTLDTPYFHLVYSQELAEELHYSYCLTGKTYPDDYEFYDIDEYLPVVGSRFFFGGHQTQYGHVIAPVADLARQRAITGQQIDMVMGSDAARLHFSKDNTRNWYTLTDSEGRNLLEYHTDVKMEVPYDWGKGEE